MCSAFFSKYTILSKLGEGTFSDVLKCEKLSTGEIFAVKKLKKQFKEFSEIKYLAELIVLLKLTDHKNVLTLFEYIFDSTEGRLYMVFEIMDMSLYELIQAHKKGLSENKVKHMFYQLLKGVEHLHSNGLLHRDVKPENILVKKSLLKLADLGSVRGIQGKPPYTDYISTRWYRAPECMLSAGFYGAKADVWACGCVFYEMLTSKPIFPGENDIDQLTKIHQVTGTPNARIINKMRRSKSRVGDVKFAQYQSTNVAAILPFTSDGGREILRRMLVYDPDVRSNIRRLLENKYFNDLKERDNVKQSSDSSRPNSLPHIQSNYKMIQNNKSCNNLQSVRSKPKEIIYNNNKDTDKKLVTKTWGPSSSVTKFDSTSIKSRSINKIVCNTRQNYNPSNRIKLAPDKLEIKQSLQDIKINKADSRRILPKIRSKDQLGELGWKSFTKEILPPILEQ